MSRYPDRADGILIPLAVLAANLLDRPITFGGYTVDTGDRQALRGVVIGLNRSVVFGVCR